MSTEIRNWDVVAKAMEAAVQRQAKCISVPKRWQKGSLTQCLQAFRKLPTASLLLLVDQKRLNTHKRYVD